MKIGMAADHAGFALKKRLAEALRNAGHAVTDVGPFRLVRKDDFPDYVAPLARKVARGEVER